jgi:predicted Zn finger-like uncharacterized protein
VYTQCPDCRASFRVTAAVLQQAAGRVRCGGCGYAFNALERLSETPPDAGDRRALPDRFDALSAKDNVRIEDTGVEWQVVGDEEPADSDPQEALDLVNAPDTAEQRYDDNTPLPGVFEDDEDERAPEPPRRRAEDFLEPRSPEFDERQVDLALSEPEDWTDLLDEVGDAVEPATTDEAEGGSGTHDDDDTQSGLEVLDVDAEPTGEHPALASEPAADSATLAADPEESSSREAGEAPASAPADDGHYVPPPTEEEVTINRLIDQDLLRLSQEQQDLAATGSRKQEPAESPPHVETIIMEGAFVRSSLEADEPANSEQAPPEDEDAAGDILDLRDTYVRTRDREREGSRRTAVGGRYAATAGVAALALLLAAQVVHAYRETLATYGTLGDSLISFYAAAGVPITPDWDANGWQFLETRGSTDAADSALTISSTLANASDQALPYPLLHVALTDRYEEIIASQLLEARQYLEIRAASGRVASGGKLSASITIAPLAPQAAGFKLNVCYPLNASEVRCATGAFKER